MSLGGEEDQVQEASSWECDTKKPIRKHAVSFELQIQYQPFTMDRHSELLNQGKPSSENTEVAMDDTRKGRILGASYRRRRHEVVVNDFLLRETRVSILDLSRYLRRCAISLM